MHEIDRTDLGRYLRIMAHVARNQEEKTRPSTPAADASGGNVIELHRGTIDQVWG